MTKLLIIDDQALVREGLRALLGDEDDFEIVADVASGQEAIDIVRDRSVDVALVDARMPGLDGPASIREISRLRQSTYCIILTTFEESDVVFRAINAGARGHLLKEVSIDELVWSIKAVAQGRFVFGGYASRILAGQVGQRTREEDETMRRLSALEPHRQDLVRCLAKGMSNREIASTLFIAEGTVRNQLSGILREVGLKNRTQLAVLARLASPDANRIVSGSNQ